MGRFLKPIEVVANILIVIVAVLCLVVLGQKYFRTEPPLQKTEQPNRPAAPKMPVVGSKISVVDVDWSKNKKNVLLVLQVGCRFCSESAEFYQTLIEQTKNKGVSVTAVLPQGREEARKYLDNLQLSQIETKQSALSSLDVSGTPTLIVADASGQIEKVWLGKLPSEKQGEVLAMLLR